MSEVIDSQTGERFTLTDGKRRLRIASLDRVADSKEKQRLFATYGAVMVDMESATVARMAQQRAIPMCSQPPHVRLRLPARSHALRRRNGERRESGVFTSRSAGVHGVWTLAAAAE